MRSRLLLTLGVSFVLLGSGPAFAFQDIKIKEVFIGSAAHPNAQYVVLQAYSAGQNIVTGKSLRTFNSAGTHTGDFTFLGPLPIGADQMTFIIATAEAAALFNLTPDLLMTPVLTAVGGHICWNGATPDECFSWGNFPGDPQLAGTPYHVRAGLIPGYAARRRLDICMTGLLEACDDTNQSVDDFITVIPDPVTNAGVHGTPPPSTCANGVLEGLERCDDNNTVDGDGCSAVCRIEPDPLTPAGLEVDEHVHASSDGNGVFEMGETAEVAPSWSNGGGSGVAVGGQFTNPLGPADLYSIINGGADYGTIPPAGTASCEDSEDCYLLAVPVQTRPSLHWDTTVDEILSTSGQKTWTVHIGESFPDVPRAHPFYAFIENLFHNRVTGGCAGGNYCPGDPVTRAQMAVFLLKASLGPDHVPPPCTGAVFTDVPCTGGPFDPWIEELASLGVTGGCGGGNYCPGAAVTRQQMAVFLLKALEGSSFDPPDCTGIFTDVPCTPGVGFPDWIEELFNRQITGGCGGGNYCPTASNTRGQMAVFLVKTFGLLLYGP
jgi:cysteine-rich repeat protein